MKTALALPLAALLVVCGCICAPAEGGGKNWTSVTFSRGGGLTPVPWGDTMTITSEGRITRNYTWGELSYVRTANASPADFSSFKKAMDNALDAGIEPVYDCNTMCIMDAPGTALLISTDTGKIASSVAPGSEPPPHITALIANFTYFKPFFKGFPGEFCGGIAAFQCESGLECQLAGDYPDAGGVCVFAD